MACKTSCQLCKRLVISQAVTFADGVLEIEGSGAMTNVGGSSGPPWFNFAPQVTSVSLPEGITSIGSCAGHCLFTRFILFVHNFHIHD